MVDDRGAGAVLIASVRHVAETGSTNADCLALATAGAPEGFWLRADRQTGGRGRQGREWRSPSGNLYASTIVRLRPADPPAATLALVAAVALAEAVLRVVPLGDRLRLKWPNDLLVDGAKLSGILLERAGDAVVVGIGVNLASHPSDLDRPAISLSALGAPVEPADFLGILAPMLMDWLARWRGQGVAPVRDRWLALAHPPGTALAVNLLGDQPVQGLFDGLAQDGALLLRLNDGSQRVVHAAEVCLL